jgi:hypothetical protein
MRYTFMFGEDYRLMDIDISIPIPLGDTVYMLDEAHGEGWAEQEREREASEKKAALEAKEKEKEKEVTAGTPLPAKYTVRYILYVYGVPHTGGCLCIDTSLCKSRDTEAIVGRSGMKGCVCTGGQGQRCREGERSCSGGH